MERIENVLRFIVLIIISLLIGWNIYHGLRIQKMESRLYEDDSVVWELKHHFVHGVDEGPMWATNEETGENHFLGYIEKQLPVSIPEGLPPGKYILWAGRPAGRIEYRYQENLSDSYDELKQD